MMVWCFECLSIAVIELLEVKRGLMFEEVMQCMEVGELHMINVAGCLSSSILIRGGAFKNSRC
jgi:hypothetical protein